jgi:sulfite reductase (NADPH) flavoprotein alpha-component
LVASIYAVHSGEWLGLAGRIVMLSSAVAMAFFAASGTWMWLWRRRLLARSRQPQGEKT